MAKVEVFLMAHMAICHLATSRSSLYIVTKTELGPEQIFEYLKPLKTLEILWLDACPIGIYLPIHFLLLTTLNASAPSPISHGISGKVFAAIVLF